MDFDFVLYASSLQKTSLQDQILYYHLVMQPLGSLRPAISLDSTFAALADPTRRAILARLSTGTASVTELAEPFAMSQPAISKHLRVLERAGLISRGRDAQRRPRKLEAKPLAEASKWLESYRQFWGTSFSRLDGLLTEMQSTAKHQKTPSRRNNPKKETYVLSQ